MGVLMRRETTDAVIHMQLTRPGDEFHASLTLGTRSPVSGDAALADWVAPDAVNGLCHTPAVLSGRPGPQIAFGV